jgi:hypothetical protein
MSIAILIPQDVTGMDSTDFHEDPTESERGAGTVRDERGQPSVGNSADRRQSDMEGELHCAAIA